MRGAAFAGLVGFAWGVSAQNVSVETPLTTLGDLLQELETQTGQRFWTGRENVGRRLVVRWDDVPLDDAMQALAHSLQLRYWEDSNGVGRLDTRGRESDASREFLETIEARMRESRGTPNADTYREIARRAAEGLAIEELVWESEDNPYLMVDREQGLPLNRLWTALLYQNRQLIAEAKAARRPLAISATPGFLERPAHADWIVAFRSFTFDQQLWSQQASLGGLTAHPYMIEMMGGEMLASPVATFRLVMEPSVYGDRFHLEAFDATGQRLMTQHKWLEWSAHLGDGSDPLIAALFEGVEGEPFLMSAVGEELQSVLASMVEEMVSLQPIMNLVREHGLTTILRELSGELMLQGSHRVNQSLVAEILPLSFMMTASQLAEETTWEGLGSMFAFLYEAETFGETMSWRTAPEIEPHVKLDIEALLEAIDRTPYGPNRERLVLRALSQGLSNLEELSMVALLFGEELGLGEDTLSYFADDGSLVALLAYAEAPASFRSPGRHVFRYSQLSPLLRESIERLILTSDGSLSQEDASLEASAEQGSLRYVRGQSEFNLREYPTQTLHGHALQQLNMWIEVEPEFVIRPSIEGDHGMYLSRMDFPLSVMAFDENPFAYAYEGQPDQTFRFRLGRRDRVTLWIQVGPDRFLTKSLGLGAKLLNDRVYTTADLPTGALERIEYFRQRLAPNGPRAEEAVG